MAKPNLKDSKANFKLIWNSEFNENELNQDKWRFEKILPDHNDNRAQMSQHVTNTFGFDTDGNKKDGAYPLGKRHAMWYDKHLDKTLKIRDGSLVMGGYKSDEDDPTIKDSHHPYEHPRNGKTADFRKKIYTSWIDTYAMTWEDGAVRPSSEHSPNFYFRYGFVEFGVNFENVHTEGFRISGWLLPAVNPSDENKSLVGGTYDDDDGNGVELDVWEYENTPSSRNLLLCKNIGANAKKIPPVDLGPFGIDMTKGDHTIAVHWSTEGTRWYVDGVLICEDLVCKVEIAMALYLTREGNSGANSGGGVTAQPPFIQNDPGLYAYNLGTESAETINSDEALIHYVRVWQDEDHDGNWIAPNWRNGEGVEAIGDKPVAATPSATPVTSNDAEPLVMEDTDSEFGLKINGNVLTWNQTHDENKYDIKFDKNEYKKSVKGTTFTIPDSYKEGTYYVTATPSSKRFIDSNKVEYSKSNIVDEPVVNEPTTDTESAAVIIAQITKLLAKLRKLS